MDEAAGKRLRDFKGKASPFRAGVLATILPHPRSPGSPVAYRASSQSRTVSIGRPGAASRRNVGSTPTGGKPTGSMWFEFVRRPHSTRTRHWSRAVRPRSRWGRESIPTPALFSVALHDRGGGVRSLAWPVSPMPKSGGESPRSDGRIARPDVGSTTRGYPSILHVARGPTWSARTRSSRRVTRLPRVPADLPHAS